MLVYYFGKIRFIFKDVRMNLVTWLNLIFMVILT